MGLIYVPKPWTEQPQGVVGVAPEYSARVTSAAIGYVSPTEAANYAFPLVVNAAGVGVDPTAVFGRYIVCNPTNTADFALVAGIVPATVSGILMQASRDDSDAGGSARVFQLRTNGAGVEFIRFNTAASPFTATAANVLAIGRPAFVVASSRRADIRVWVNGVAATATMTGTPQTWPTSAGSASRWFERFAGPLSGDHSANASFLRVILKGGLSEAEGLALSLNPWQLFAPRKTPIFYGGEAATAPTISALSARLITSTSAQPRISYS